MIVALPASLALARLANSVAETSNSDPGSPTWPNLSSSCASAGWLNTASNPIHNSLDIFMTSSSRVQRASLFYVAATAGAARQAVLAASACAPDLVIVGHDDRGQRAAVLGRIAAQDFQPPAAHRAAGRLGMAVVAREHVRQAF